MDQVKNLKSKRGTSYLIMTIALLVNINFVYAQCPTITEETGDATTCVGGSASIRVKSSFNNSTYLWQVLIPGNASWMDISSVPPYSIASNNSSGSTLTINPTPALLNNYQFRVTINSCITSTARTLTVTPAVTQASTNSIQGYYPFNNSAADEAGTGNAGALFNSPTLTTDRFNWGNSAYNFPSTTQYIATAKQFTNPTTFSIAIWFRSNTLRGGRLIGFGSARTGANTNSNTSTVQDRALYMTNEGKISFGVKPTATSERIISSNLSYNDNQWHLAAATCSATSGIKLYIDGVEVASDATATPANYSGYWRMNYDDLTGFSNRPTNNTFIGALDDAIIYSREISLTEITTLFKNINGTTSNSPVCMGGNIVLTGATVSGATYEWRNPAGNIIATTSTHTISSASSAHTGTYRLITRVNGCETFAFTNVKLDNALNLSISQVPTAGLIGKYYFSGDATDATNTNHGVAQNNPSLTTDRFGNTSSAYLLNGSTQYISTSQSYLNPNNFTVSIWFRTNTTFGGKLVGFGNVQVGESSLYDRHIYMTNAGQIYFGINPVPGGHIINSSRSYNDGFWHLVTGTLSPAGMRLYIDGAEIGRIDNAVSGELYPQVGYWKIGFDNLGGWVNAPSSKYFSGSVDDVLFYNEALTAEQVATLYSSPDGAGNYGPKCTGSTITLTATEISGATYAWTGPNSFTSALRNPSISNAASAHAGTYTVTVTSSGCNATAQTAITIVALPSAPTATAGTRCGAGTVTLTASGSPSTYNWYSVSSGGTSLATTASFTTPTLSSTTIYYVSSVNSSGCEGPRTAVTATVTGPILSFSSVTNCNAIVANSSSLDHAAISLDGIDDHLTVPSGVYFNGNFTAEAWVYLRSYNNWNRLFDFGNGPSNNNVYMALSEGMTGKLAVGIFNGTSGSYITSYRTLPLNEWVHVAFSLSGTTGIIYINGFAESSGTFFTPAAVTRNNNYIGSSNWVSDGHTNATIDELRIWNVARSADDIKNNMNTVVNTSTAGLQNYWRMNENTGSTTVDSKTGSNATLVNSPTWIAAGSPVGLTYTWSPATGLSSTTGYAVKATPGSVTTYTVTVSNGVCSSSAPITVTPLPTPSFGNGQWNAYVYVDTTFTTLYGQYTESSLSFSSTSRWGINDAPSSASGYTGCPVSSDYHSVRYMRTNLTAGYYEIVMPEHDDDVRLLINGSSVFFEAGWTITSKTVWTGYLTASSTIELRWKDGYGASVGALNFIVPITYTWTGSSNTVWQNSANWSPVGIPTSIDTMVIESGAFMPAFGGHSINVGGFKQNNGIINLNGGTLALSGRISFSGGELNNGTLDINCSQVTFEGTEFGANVNTVCQDVYMHGSTFNAAVNVEKTGPSNNLGNGGNVYNGATNIVNSGAGNFVLANLAGDDYNGSITFVKTSTGALSPAYNGSSTFSGNIIVNSASAITFGSGTGTAVMDGGSAQTISITGAASPIFNRLTINKTGGDVSLSTPVRIANNLNLVNGKIISSDLNLLTFNDGANISSVSNASFVEGPVRKLGDDAFTFPIGRGDYYRPIGISAPQTLNGDFTASYFSANPLTAYANAALDTGLHHISSNEYWILNKGVGSNDSVFVTLTWNSNSGVIDPNDLRVTRWYTTAEGGQWQNHKGVASFSTVSNGTVTSGAQIKNFSPFTLGSSTPVNPMPINILFFNAKKIGANIELSWKSTVNNNAGSYEVERTKDLRTFEKVSGSGVATLGSNSFQAIDANPYVGTSYYRLKQMESNGRYSYSDVVQVQNNLTENSVSIFPNPFKNSFTVNLNEDLSEKSTIVISRVDGTRVFSNDFSLDADYNALKIDMDGEKSGIYVLEIKTRNRVIRKVIIKE